MPTTNDYDHLIKRINPGASASNVAAATLALMLLEAQLGAAGSASAASLFDASSSPAGSDFDRLVDSITTSINAL